MTWTLALPLATVLASCLVVACEAGDDARSGQVSQSSAASTSTTRLDDATRPRSDSYAPFDLGSYSESEYALSLSAEHMISVDEVFEEHGQYNNGYAWEAVARQAMRVNAPEILPHVEFDSEADLFSVFSRDRDALERLARLMRDAYEDPRLLGELIEGADPGWF